MTLIDTLSTIEKVIGGVVGIILLWLIKKIVMLFMTWGQFITDWNGQKPRKGRDEVPGVMARLNKLDGELSHNGGKSIKDVVVRLEARQDILEQKLEEAEIARQQNHIIVLEAIKSLSTRKAKN